MRLLGPDPELNDLLQDVFVAALASIRKLDNPKALRAWLARIAVHHVRHCLRRRKRWSFVRFLSPDDVAAARAPQPDPEASEALRATYRVLAALPADERIAFALRFVEGMDLAEIAAACGVSLATTKRRIARAEGRFSELARAEPALVEWLAAPRGTAPEGSP
jgi:RNA polymerase sigma-70 factor (ECF subfamily)